MAYPRRDRYDDGYFGPPPDDRFSGPPPRRHKSERHRRRSPDINPKYTEDAYPSRRGYSRRDPPESRGMMQSFGGGRRARSPPPYYNPGPAPVPRESRKEPKHGSRHERDMPRDRYDRDRDLAPPRDHGSSRDKPRRSHRDEPEYRPRRERASPPPEYRSRGREGRSHKSRAVSPEPKSRARDLLSAGHAGSDDKKSHRRPRSHDRSHKRDKSPARGRDRAVAPAAKVSSTSRRKSAPAPTTAKKQAWWQNPLIQAGARTAFTAGAQAAMQNRNDPSPWLGSKGAKVATAALGAALMDGFGGKKKDK